MEKQKIKKMAVNIWANHMSILSQKLILLHFKADKAIDKHMIMATKEVEAYLLKHGNKGLVEQYRTYMTKHKKYKK